MDNTATLMRPLRYVSAVARPQPDCRAVSLAMKQISDLNRKVAARGRRHCFRRRDATRDVQRRQGYTRPREYRPYGQYFALSR